MRTKFFMLTYEDTLGYIAIHTNEYTDENGVPMTDAIKCTTTYDSINETVDLDVDTLIKELEEKAGTKYHDLIDAIK